jgi:hypothetical protein
MAAVLLSAGLGAAPPRNRPTRACFPTAVGARWSYQTTGGQDTTQIVTGVEEKDGAKIVTVALLMEDGKTFPMQKVSVSGRGLFLVWAYGKDCQGPVFLLRQPHSPGEKWENLSIIADMPFRELAEGSGHELVATPAGAFRAYRVASRSVGGFAGPSRTRCCESRPPSPGD